ncbi:BTAD domain-containing putative transcriptional regulator [Deinococcus deserti]|uniref:BTAD domain-containing putative transcriptional regulator n=1 Tax=Deinococcus deserti TaxID=310783 RepID=UPI0002FD163D|nr:BTAD domain-containing putative transcriptional regulator [Deinococcus deserti]
MNGRPVTLPTRKAFALVAYLAVEGATSRAMLASLLWGDTDEERARGHLRREVYRLRQSPLASLVVTSPDAVALDPAGHTCDVTCFEAQYHAGQCSSALRLWRGELLEGFDLRCAEGFELWLQQRREALACIHHGLLASCARAEEEAGQLRTALALHQELLRSDELAEPHHREVMRLHARLGERGAALQQFARLRQVLADELALEPLPETVALAREILRGTPSPALPAASVLPLVGREREWAQLEEAWARGQMTYLCGEPGVGKTRLMLDFVATKGASVPNDGRPGDVGLPYASIARGLRQLLERQPGLMNELAPWARRELSRLLPGMWNEVLPPLSSHEDRLRLFEAGMALLALGTRGYVALTTDDLHLFDPQSFEFGACFTAGPPVPPWPPLRVLATFQRRELPDAAWEAVQTQVERGAAALIEVQPLSCTALADLLRGLGLPEAQATELSVPLHRYTGGNPLFALETARYLMDQGQLIHGLTSHMLPPRQTGAIIRRRLDSLPAGALRLAQVAAVADRAFSLELAGRVLNTEALTLTPDLQALEQAGLWQGERFAYDLLRVSVLAGLPVASRRLLQTRVLSALHEDPAQRAAQNELRLAP